MNAGKVLLVTGGSRGIGAATAKLAAARGWAVAVNYVEAKDRAEALVARIERAGGRAAAFKADLGDPRQIAPLFDAAEESLGKLGGLVNSAGRVGRSSPLIDCDPADVVRTIELNLTGLILATREAIRRMAKSRGGLGGGIVNISSAAATLGSTGEFVWYAASKGGIDIFTEGVAREVAADGLRINAVSPGMIETEIHASAGDPGRVARITPSLPMKRAGSAEEVAEAVLWLLSDAASYVTGANIRVAGGR
jgi:NAD(P)-dependent dehydrogenase (short-subunit alcohol dehydrogenase family)